MWSYWILFLFFNLGFVGPLSAVVRHCTDRTSSVRNRSKSATSVVLTDFVPFRTKPAGCIPGSTKNPVQPVLVPNQTDHLCKSIGSTSFAGSNPVSITLVEPLTITCLIHKKNKLRHLPRVWNPSYLYTCKSQSITFRTDCASQKPVNH